MTITGRDLIDLGFQQGPELGPALEQVNSLGLAGGTLFASVEDFEPVPRVCLHDTTVFRPYGSIMAGDWERDAPWRKRAIAKHRGADRR